MIPYSHLDICPADSRRQRRLEGTSDLPEAPKRPWLGPRGGQLLGDPYLAALRRVAINEIFSCLVKKPNKPKKAKDLKLQ